MSTLQRVKLADIQYVGSSAGSIYSNPSSTKTLVAGVTLFNGNTTTETVKVYIVPDNGSGGAGTASGANQVAQLSMQANDTVFLEFPFPFVLTDTGDSIQASTTTASKVTAVVHGDTVV